MAKVGNWVGETTNTSGTGVLTLDGPLDGYTSFSAYGDGEYWYTIINGNNRESGICTFDTALGLDRTNVQSTLVEGILDTAPAGPIDLVGSSTVLCTFNKEAFDELEESIVGTISVPETTILTVGADKQFQTINDAIEFVRKHPIPVLKPSSTLVTDVSGSYQIVIDNGNYTLPVNTRFDFIPCRLTLRGASTAGVIINFSYPLYITEVPELYFESLTLVDGNTAPLEGLVVTAGSHLHINAACNLSQCNIANYGKLSTQIDLSLRNYTAGVSSNTYISGLLTIANELFVRGALLTCNSLIISDARATTDQGAITCIRGGRLVVRDNLTINASVSDPTRYGMYVNYNAQISMSNLIDNTGANLLISNIAIGQIQPNGSCIYGAIYPIVLKNVKADISIKYFGAPMDGVSDDGPAINNSLDAFGYAYIPEGTATILTPILMPSNGVIFGDGQDVSILITDAAMSRTARMISNAGMGPGGVRAVSNLTIKDLTIADARVWPTYPSTGWDNAGYLIYFVAVDGYLVSNCEIKNCPNIAFADTGCKNGKVDKNYFHDNGRDDRYSPALNVNSAGSDFTIVDITRASPAVVTVFNHAATLNAAATSINIQGVTQFSGIPDGVYNITTAGTNKFNLTGINTSAEPVAYVCSQTSCAGDGYGGLGDFFKRAENTTVTNNRFEDNAFHHMAFHPDKGIISNNVFLNTTEAAIFISGGKSITIADNIIDGVGVVSVVGDGIEANRCADINITGNQISNTATYAIGSNSMENGVWANNIFRDIITDNAAVFPPWTTNPGGGLLDKFAVLKVGCYDQMPGSNINICGNSVIDIRTGATQNALNFVEFNRQGTLATNNVYDISIENNILNRSGIPVANMFIVKTTSVCKQERIYIKGNKGHNSQGPYVVEQILAGGEVGIKHHNIGFVPSFIEIFAYNPSVTRAWSSTCSLSKGPAGNIYSSNYFATDNAVEPRLFGTTSSSVAYQIVDDVGTLKGRALLHAWLCDSTNGIGVSINVTNAVDPITYRLVCHP